MKKFFLLSFFLLTSCNEIYENIGCGMPTYVEQERAKHLYSDIMSARVPMSYDEARKLFGCYYTRGDRVYGYSRMFESGYLLVRNGQAIAYREK